MPTNPLEPNPKRDARIREVATELWNDEGKPAGGADAYLERAADLVGMEESKGAGEIPVNELPPAERDWGPIEDASIQENLGEFPQHGTDQGEQHPTPKPDKT